MNVTSMVNAFGVGKLFSCKENISESHSNFSPVSGKVCFKFCDD